MRVATPQSMLDADFEYGLQPTKWQTVDVMRGYPSLYEVPGSEISVSQVTTNASSASGGIEAVFAILALEQGLLYPNLNFSTPIVETGLVPQLKFEDGKTIKNVLSNSFGFGGNNSTVILSAI